MRTIVLMLLAGILATAIGMIGYGHRNHFHLPREFLLQESVDQSASELPPSVVESMARADAAHAVVRRQNAALVGGVYGAGLCGLAGFVAGWVTRRRSLVGAAT